MKNKKHYLKKSFVCCIILMIVFSIFLVSNSVASIRPEITDPEEKQKLLFGEPGKVDPDNILGIAGYFSIFAFEDVYTYGADIEGRLAVGGIADFSGSEWPYQVGCGYNEYQPSKGIAAEVIVGGEIHNLNVFWRK